MSKNHSKKTFIEEIIQACQTQLVHQSSDQTFSKLSIFIRQFYHHVSIEYLEKIAKYQGLEILISRVLRAWQLFQYRPSYSPIIDFYEKPVDLSNPELIAPLTITLISTDRPFLVDSLKAILKQNGFNPEAILHPILKVVRDSHGHLQNLEPAQGRLDEEKIIPITSKIHVESLICLVLEEGGDEERQHELHQAIIHLLERVALVVDDFDKMRDNIFKLSKRYQSFDENLQYLGLENHPYGIKDIGVFLSWLVKDNFIFTGCRYFAAKAKIESFTLMKDRKSEDHLALHFENEEITNGGNCGLFRESYFSHLPELTPKACRLDKLFLNDDETHQRGKGSNLQLFTILKSSKRSPVHRCSRLNSIEILDVDESGTICGLYQFIGLFTREFFNHSAFEIPLLKHKVTSVFDRFGLSPKWHDGKYLINILKSVPQDELFQFRETELYHLCEEILEIHNNKNLSVILRPDPYGKFLSVLVYLPKDRYSFDLKEKILNFLSQEFDGIISSDQVLMSEFPFARLIAVLSFENVREFSYNKRYLQEKLNELSLSWEEKLDQLILGGDFNVDYKLDFSKAYQDSFSPNWALEDVKNSLEVLAKQSIVFSLEHDDKQKMDVLKVFHLEKALPLSLLMPMLENFGLRVVSEVTYEALASSYQNSKKQSVWAHYFYFEHENSLKKDKQRVIEAFYDVWHERVENDAFNHLTLKGSLTAREASIFRIYAKFLKQVEFGYSHELMASVLSLHQSITQTLRDLFVLRFTFPYTDSSKTEEKHLLKTLEHQLQSVVRNDHDEILKRFLNCILSTVRTNFYQEPHKEYISFKFDCSSLIDLPKPYPHYEIFIYSPFMEACHLRGDKVARGGIRWSDRHEDFRSEVLGLMKAQMVKNSIIVPLGSKGGFISKHYEKMQTSDAPSNELKQEVVRCYQTMMRGLLDLTDNWVQGKVEHPCQMVCHDEEDPYLVVAADKGTSSFSDFANEISKEYEFWLDDAFASGGSHGYDHKKMAITAKGAWISVERHFRELGVNIYNAPFSVVGVGDMSGDVFGNGMLRSSLTKLIAAFNHQHIFIDPNPDPIESFEERRRLFNLPNSSWADYDSKHISKGGGVFSRAAKGILLSPEIKQLFGIDQHLSELSPNELILILLKSKVDLLWFGGIGTFIKASQESNGDVHDRHNNPIRVDAKDINAKVIGEGANLALTQRARVEFSLQGGKINTDAIDNSAGVDCSDHEVNLKILFSHLLQEQKIERSERDKLLQEMTSDVAHLVLKDNQSQTLILSLMELSANDDLDAYQELIHYLESDSKMPLHRKVEFIPNDEELSRRSSAGKGLTRPELAILLAYSKNSLYRHLMSSIKNTDLTYLNHYFMG
ncbi:MAG: NAD-glutamate dehydrogenase, partial [Alphaproteobacteria bacterium]|nr:NAD-glutamate dehydrogenase [Alphaproteobacteria bacterium]